MTQSKSKIARKLARKRGVKVVEIRMPTFQLTPADFLGLPTVKGNDELVAQIKSDREIGDYRLGDTK